MNLAGVAFIGTYEPVYDAVFSDPGIEYIKFNTVFTLDQNNYVSGEYYNFNPNNYVSAFSIYDDDHTELLSADLSFARIDINNTVGNINSSFSVNLHNYSSIRSRSRVYFNFVLLGVKPYLILYSNELLHIGYISHRSCISHQIKLTPSSCCYE